MASDSIIQVYGEIALIRITKPRLTEVQAINEIAAEIEDVINRLGRPMVILDMSRVEFLSSAMLGKLIALFKQVKKAKGKMAVCGVNKTLMELFRVTKLHKMFEFYDDAEPALNAYRRAQR